LEIYSAIVVLAPLVAPLGVAFGVEPVHLGVVFLANLELGFLFPPMGLNLFLSASRFQKPLPLLYRKAVPFLVIMAVGVLLITYVPAITTPQGGPLPRHHGGGRAADHLRSGHHHRSGGPAHSRSLTRFSSGT